VSIRSSFFPMLLCALLGAMVPQARAAAPIVVAQSIDLSGPNGSIGRDYVAGIATYFDGLNARGGVNGRKISYVVADDHGVPADAAGIAGATLREGKADFLLGGIGADATEAVLAAPGFADSRHVLFAPLATPSERAKARVLYWRPGIESEFLFLLVYFDKLGIKDVGIALQETAQNNKSFAFLTAEMRKRHMRLAGVAKLSGSAVDLQADAQRLAASGAKLVITIGNTIASAQFLRAFRRYDPSTFVAGTSLTNLTTLAEIAGARATEFTVFSQVVPNPDSNLSLLQAEHIEMMKRYRDEPVSAVTLEGYAVAKTLVKMMRFDGAGKSRALSAELTPMDLGGVLVRAPAPGASMSRYVDIALFTRGGKLMF
jgi:branched-chain amino acid transport system substrate-binding protein